MRGIENGVSHLVIYFDQDEAGVLAGTVDQLADLLDGENLAPHPVADAGEGTDPFSQWEAEFSHNQLPTVEDDDEDEPDPVLHRLFPDAYPDDPEASHDFRRFTQADQSRQKVADARTVLADLQTTDRRGRCRVPLAHTTAWLKTLANVRLALAVRLDITDEVSADEASQRPDNDPRAWLHEIYAWVGWLQECLLDAL